MTWLSSRFRRWIVRTCERLIDRYNEGIEPPSRLGDMVVWWANEHPRATREEWVDFATEHAEESYQAGYIRGHQFADREDFNGWGGDPEDIADTLDADWRLRPGAVLINGKLLVLTAEESEAAFAAVRELTGVERIVYRAGAED